MSRALSGRLASRHLHPARATLVLALALATFSALVAAYSAPAIAAENIREVPPSATFVTGQVEQSADEGATWIALGVESRISRKALVRTLAAGSCVLTFEDGTLVALKPGSTIQVLPWAPEMRVALKAGEAWVRFDYASENSRNGVGLPQATVLVLGAGDFTFRAAADLSVIGVLDGAVAVVAPGSTPPVGVTAGKTVTAGPAGLQPVASLDVSAERAAWQALFERAGLSVTTTTLAPPTSTSQLPPDGPVRSAWPGIALLAVMGWAALGVIAILATLIYVLVARIRR